MKKILAFVCAAILSVGAVNAKLMFQESFEREVGTLKVGDATSSEISDMADWWSYSGTSDYIKVAEGSLSYAGYQSTGKGNKAHIWTTKADDLRQFSAVSSGKAYLAAIINVEELRQGTNPDYFLCFGDKTTTSTKMFGRLWTKSVKEGEKFVGFRLGIGKLTENEKTAVRYTSDVYAPQTNYLVVIEYVFKDGDKNDEVRLYVNPTKATTTATLECLQDSTNATGTQLGAIKFDDASKLTVAILRQGSNTPRQVYVDEIKVATAWADLWETGGSVDPTPAIDVASSLAFDGVYVGEAVEKKIAVKGSDLKGAISVASNNAALVPAVTSISKAEAEAGYELKLTLTAAAVGDGSAKVTLSSDGAASQEIAVSWTGINPPEKVANIAAFKLKDAGTNFMLQSEPVVVGFIEGNPVLQDETGAIIMQALMIYGATNFENLKVGDKVKNFSAYMMESIDFVRSDLATANLTSDVQIVSSDNELVPFEVTAANIAKYGPAFIKLLQVEFTDTDKENFAAGWFNISQEYVAARIQVPAGCDIIGDAIPAKADVVGLLIYANGGIQIRKSADVYNRVPRGGGTNIDNMNQSSAAKKIMRNGQLVIEREGKIFNAVGTEL